MPNSVFEKIMQGGAKVAEDVVGTIVPGKPGQALAGGIAKIASMKALGGADSLEKAKQQDHDRMHEQYGF